MSQLMTRRGFVKASLAGSLSLATLGSGAQPAKTKPRKPNLLFIWTDEQRADTMAVYGNHKIHAPNLNKLADECVVFKNAYVTQPVCTPSRSSVMTGLWPHQSGLVQNNIALPRDVRCVPERLSDPDYRTGYMGKWHLGDEIFAQHGFEEWVSIEDVYSPYYSEGRDKNQRSDYHHFLVEHGQKPGEDGKFSRTFAARLPLELSKPKFLEGKACDFLRRHRGEPFVLYVNFLEPHPPYTGPLNNEYDPRMIDFPSNFTYPLGENEPLRYRLMQEKHRAKDCKDEETLRQTTARYWGLVTEVDRSVGAILKTLEDLGLADNTLVVYTSDHGDMMGSHCLMAKSVMYQEATHIPWLMRIPGMGGRGRIIEGPTSHIDMVPTVLDAMGSQAGEGLSGQSLVPLLKGGKVGEDHVIVEWNRLDQAGSPKGKKKGKKSKSGGKGKKTDSEGGEDPSDKARFRTVVAPDGWKLSLSDVDKCQLFNLAKDPGETANLFGAKEHQDVVRRLTERIHQWQEKVRDTVKV